MGKNATNSPELPPKKESVVGMMDFKPPQRNSKFVATAVVIMGTAALTRPESLMGVINLRGAFPEPFDISNHVANTAWTFTAVFTALTGLRLKTTVPHNTFGVGNRSNRGYIELMTDEIHKRRRNWRLGITATLGTALNFYGETVLASTPRFDGMDFLYGLAGGAAAYVTSKPEYFDPEETAAVMTGLPEDNPLKGRYDELSASLE